MSKKSKKTKFNKVAVTWKEDDLMLPTIAAPIAPRRSYGAGGFDRGGFGSNRGGYGNSNKQEESESDRGPWRRGPASQPPTNSNSFTSNRNPPRNAGSSFNSFRSANTRNPSNDTPDDLNASENDRNWRNSKKKEQPKISLNSTISSTNINPWRNNNNNSNSRTEPQGAAFGSGSGRTAFGSKSLSQTAAVASPSSFSRTSFGSRSNNSFSDGNSGNGNGSRYGGSKFGGGSSSKYGGGGGSSSTSKFNTGGGFGAAALKNIDNGTTRLSYSRNNRFSGIMEESKAEKSVRFEAPSKSVGNRFSKMSVSAAASEDSAFPGLRNAKTQRMRKEKTVEELNQAIKKDIARSNSERNKMELLALEQAQKKKKAASAASKPKPGKKKSNVTEESGKKKAAKSEKKVKVTEATKETKAKIKQKVIAKADKKLVRKFNRDHLGQNKYIEINGDTKRLILFGLSQKGNILKRNEQNYEKIANLLCTVILNEKKGNKLDLDLIYDMLYNKTLLSTAKNEFLALILEILSLIEIKKSCLSVVHMIDSRDLSNKYLMKTPDITCMATMKEFEEYGLQYIYPLQPEIVAAFQELIEKSPSMEEIINLMQTIRKTQIIYSNYKSMHSILAYVLNAFYFAKIGGNEEGNEEIAKALIVGEEKTPFSQIIELLHCKHEEEKHDEEEEEEDDDDVDSHSLLILSYIISISSANENSHSGLISILKVMELHRLMPYKTVQKFVLCDEDKTTSSRLNALSKLTDWIAELDARQSRIAMERDNDEYEEDEDVDNTYAGNLLAQRKHKTAADYEQISYIDVE